MFGFKKRKLRKELQDQLERAKTELIEQRKQETSLQRELGKIRRDLERLEEDLRKTGDAYGRFESKYGVAWDEVRDNPRLREAPKDDFEASSIAGPKIDRSKFLTSVGLDPSSEGEQKIYDKLIDNTMWAECYPPEETRESIVKLKQKLNREIEDSPAHQMHAVQERIRETEARISNTEEKIKEAS